MQEITHCHNQRPVYETEFGETYQWDDPLEVTGEKNNPNYPNYHPFIIDIETSAELGQKPILCVGFNTLSKTLVVLYQHGYMGYELDHSTVKEMVSDFEVHDIIIHNLTKSKFEEHILRPIAEWNKEEKRKNSREFLSLAAHNAKFDIPMLGTPNDELLENDRIGPQYEQAIQYSNINMVGHRAGQFGHIFTFLDSANHFQNLRIPVADTMVAAQAMWLPASLEKACEALETDIDVSVADEHGILKDEYVEYCINDVFATKELYDRLQARILSMFGNLPIEHIYSTASIGKYVLRKMGYKRTGYSQEAVDRIAPAYFGGRTDAEITGEIVEDLRYTDILSQYPTVSKLTNVWEYMQCEEVTIEQIPVSNLPEPDDLTNPEAWKEIANYYVKIKPNGATLPVRTPHLEDTTKVVTSKVYSEIDLQYHYMDVLSSELIDGERKPEIVAAWEVRKHGEQKLEGTKVAGVGINPEDNVMAKCIESRKEIQYEQGYKDSRTLSLKITANSLYGISAERIVKEVQEMDVEKHDFASERGFYNPHVATTITAGGRLMLALGERKAMENNGELAYCDTDSLILSDNCANDVIDAFEDLNPYSGVAGDMQVLEDEKEEIGNLYAVGTKKYIFFNDDGKPLEVKEHGLGNYENLRDEKIINRLWATVMYYDLEKNPLDVDILYGKLDENVLWSFNASTISMRKMIDDMTDDYVRYGDWMQSTLSFDDETRYIALNLMEKDANDEICKVKCDGEDMVTAKTVEKTEMLRDNSLKTVRDVVMKFTQDAGMADGRPEVHVTELKSVTKEATNRKDIFVAKLEHSFRQNMEKATAFIFG